MNPTDNLYVVTCIDLHAAIGIFLGVESALAAAHVLTDKGGCVFIPVKLEVLGNQDLKAMKAPESVKTVDTVDYSKKGYL